MKKILLFLTMFIAATFVGCQTDTMKDVSEGDWNRDKNITEIKFENQIGVTSIKRDESGGYIEFSYNMDVTGSKNITVTSVVASVGAKSSVAVGDVIDFNNPANSATLTVTAQDGSTLEWSILMKPFSEPIKGTWSIATMNVYGGCWQGTWGGDEFKVMEGPLSTLFQAPDPDKELDNKYTFNQEGFTDKGNPYGVIINDAGADGLYADYVYSEDHGVTLWDCNRIYRKIPKSGGTWEHDTTMDIYYIKDSQGSVITTTKFETAPFTYKYGATSTVTKDFAANTLVFDVLPLGHKVGDNSNMYSTIDIVVNNPTTYMITLQK